MTQISGIPDELDAYTATTTPAAFALQLAADTALAAIVAFNDANAASDVPGTIVDVATPVEAEADILRDHDKIPAAFADALLALDADGVADTLGLYRIDNRYGAFIDALVQARIDKPWATPDMAFSDALGSFDPGFAQTFAEVRAGDPSATTDVVWDTSIERQAVKDADMLALLMSDGFDESGEGMAYQSLSGLMASIESRSAALGGYAEQLYIDELGADGVAEVLGAIGEIRPDDGADVRGDWIEPFAAGFAVAAASPRGTPLIDGLTTYGNERDPRTSQMEALAMLVTGADQPAAFLVPAAETMIRHASMPPDNLPPLEVFFGDDPGTWEIIAVEALAENPEASTDFASRNNGYQVNLRNLIYGPMSPLIMNDDALAERFLTASGTVLENAILTEGTLGTGDQRTPTDELLIDVIELSQRHVPDQMKEQLAALSASTMGRIEDFVVAGGDLQDEVQAYFAELSHNDRAVQYLTLGAIDHLATEGAAAIDVYAGLDHDAPGDVFDLELILRDGTSDARQLLGTLGAGFNDADVHRDEQHAAMLGALNWIGDGAPRVGVALTPLTGGTAALAGVAAGGIADIAISVFGDFTAPSAPDESDEFVEQVGPSSEAVIARLLYDNPTARAQLVDASFADDNVQPDPATVSFDDFVELDAVVPNIGAQGGDVEDSVILDLLYNDFRRK